MNGGIPGLFPPPPLARKRVLRVRVLLRIQCHHQGCRRVRNRFGTLNPYAIFVDVPWHFRLMVFPRDARAGSARTSERVGGLERHCRARRRAIGVSSKELKQSADLRLVRGERQDLGKKSYIFTRPVILQLCHL